MIKLIPIALISILLSACAPRVYELKGQYKKDVTEIRQYPTEKKDELWVRIMTFFADNNIAIKTIDKSAGFVKSEKLNFTPYTWGEPVKRDTLNAQNMYVVSTRFFKPGDDRPPYFSSVMAAVSIFTIDSAGQTMLRVRLDGLAPNTNYPYQPKIETYSLGKLEKDLADYLTGKSNMPRCRFDVIKEYPTR